MQSWHDNANEFSPASRPQLHGIRTPQQSRDVCPVGGPESAGKPELTPCRSHHAQGDNSDGQPSIRSLVTSPHCAQMQRRRGRYSITTVLFQRECRSVHCVAPRIFLQDFRSAAESTYEIDNSHNGGSPPFSLQFGKTKRAETLAVADEDGYVSLINTAVRKDEMRSTHKHSWLCHRNAIFDVSFAEGDDLLATASGDQTIRIWDLSPSHPALNMTLRGHVSSVKAVKFRPGSQHEVVSGAREGNIFLWDTRTPGSARFESQPVQRINGAHVKDSHTSRQSAGGAAARNRRNEQFHHSVTSVVFLDDTVLASAGANDGTVKLWDLRKAFQQKGMSIRSFMSRQASATGRPRGISSLALNSTKTKLLASSADHHLYVFDCIRPEQEPVTFSGHVNNSFYVKSSFSPDDRFIVSGSSDYDVYIWDVSHPLLPPLRLKGHVGEVSDVDWCPTDFCKLASSSDDTTVRLWTVDRAFRHAPGAEADLEGVADAQGGAGQGGAEVPGAWSMPSSQSEEDSLACLETMIDSTTSWPAPSGAFPGSAAAHDRAAGHAGGSSPTGTPQAMASQPVRLQHTRPGSGASGQSTSPTGGSPTLKQARLDDIWKPVARSARPDCSPASGRSDSSMGAAGAKGGRAAAMADDPRADLGPLLATPIRKRPRDAPDAAGTEGVCRRE